MLISFLLMMALCIGVLYLMIQGLSALVNRFGGWNASYEKLGKRYAGKVGRGMLFSRPNMSFDYGRTFCRLKSVRGRRNIENRTQMRMRWHDPSMVMLVAADGALPTGGNWFNRDLQDMRLDHDENGANLTGSSNQPLRATALLTPGVRWQIRQLQNHTSRKGVSVKIERGFVFIEKPGFIKEYAELDDFVRFGLEMFDQMMLTKSMGVDFVDSDATQVVEDVKCPICSQQVIRDMVVCVRCKTPHCGDCWEYNAGCATFACNESRFVRTGQASSQS